MARFATKKYKRPTDANLADVFMHLTNYSLNKRNTDAYVAARGGSNGTLAAEEDSGEEGESSDDSDDDGDDGRRGCIKTSLPVVPTSASTSRPSSTRDSVTSRNGGCASVRSTIDHNSERPERAGVASVLPGLEHSSDASFAAATEQKESDGVTMSPPARIEAWQAKAGHRGGEPSDSTSDSTSDDSEEECDDDRNGLGGGDCSNQASKRSVDEVFGELQRRGILSDAQLSKLWSDIQDVIRKTLLAIAPAVAATYSACFPTADPASPQFKSFQIVGFDLLMDTNLKPWLIEVPGH